jgi:transposase
MKTTEKTITIPITEYESLKTQVDTLTKQVEWFLHQNRLTQHRLFGASSEKSEYEQLTIFNEAEVTATIHEPEPELTEVTKHFRKRKRLVNDRLPEDLPVEVITHDLPEAEKVCPECSGELHVMGHSEPRRELVIIPAQVKIREHVSNVYACRHCEKEALNVPIVTATATKPVIKGSFASPEAIAHIIHQKFVMATPLYRQEQDWARQGIALSRQTMSNWLLRATEDWLTPIYERLRQALTAYDVIHADETTLQVLNEPNKKAQTNSYMWLYRTSGYDRHGEQIRTPIVLYEYQPDRRAKHPKAFLKDFAGYCHADGYEGYHTLPATVTVVGCFSHARRKWDEALKMLPEKDRGDSHVLRGKRYCDKLFELERDFADLTPDERFAKRQALARPVFDEFFAWAQSLRAMPKTPLGSAVGYMVGQRKYLEGYLADGRLEISNNRAERSIKPFVIGRKNFLFANTPRGAKASAVMYSIVETAKECGVDPFRYLTNVFRLAPGLEFKDNPDVLDGLMPWNMPDGGNTL